KIFYNLHNFYNFNNSSYNDNNNYYYNNSNNNYYYNNSNNNYNYIIPKCNFHFHYHNIRTSSLFINGIIEYYWLNYFNQFIIQYHSTNELGADNVAYIELISLKHNRINDLNIYNNYNKYIITIPKKEIFNNNNEFNNNEFDNNNNN